MGIHKAGFEWQAGQRGSVPTVRYSSINRSIEELLQPAEHPAARKPSGKNALRSAKSARNCSLAESGECSIDSFVKSVLRVGISIIRCSNGQLCRDVDVMAITNLTAGGTDCGVV